MSRKISIPPGGILKTVAHPFEQSGAAKFGQQAWFKGKTSVAASSLHGAQEALQEFRVFA
jgi:hypothetical protein